MRVIGSHPSRLWEGCLGTPQACSARHSPLIGHPHSRLFASPSTTSGFLHMAHVLCARAQSTFRSWSLIATAKILHRYGRALARVPADSLNEPKAAVSPAAAAGPLPAGLSGGWLPSPGARRECAPRAAQHQHVIFG